MASTLAKITTFGIFFASSFAPAAAEPVRFVCVSVGEKLIVPTASASKVCERFRDSLARAARVTFRTDQKRFAPSGPAPRIRVTLSFTKAGVASARVEWAQGVRLTAYPEISVAVSDRAIGLQTVDVLAQSVARAIDAEGKAR